jgi:hypothetical protein
MLQHHQQEYEQAEPQRRQNLTGVRTIELPKRYEPSGTKTRCGSDSAFQHHNEPINTCAGWADCPSWPRVVFNIIRDGIPASSPLLNGS